jgi:NAD+--asparagine ADP-ribosyltransferase
VEEIHCVFVAFRVYTGDDMTEEDLEAQVEAFMKRQAEIEGGESVRKAEPGKILGEDEVNEEDAKTYCREIVQVMKSLKQKRDMTVNEIRLTVSIEDPRAREQRLMGIEDSRGVSRDEMAEALAEVSEGKIPKDRIALRELHKEMINWPFLDLEGSEPSGKCLTSTSLL